MQVSLGEGGDMAEWRGLSPAYVGAVQYRSTLAHELGHAHYGHWWSSRKHEDQADEWAARLLISPAEWSLAIALHPDCPQSVAAELGVLPRLVEVYAGWWWRASQWES